MCFPVSFDTVLQFYHGKYSGTAGCNNVLLMAYEDFQTRETKYMGLCFENKYNAYNSAGIRLPDSPSDCYSPKKCFEIINPRGPRGSSIGTLVFCFNGISLCELKGKNS